MNSEMGLKVQYRVWYCTWLSYLSDSSGYKSLTQNAQYPFWFNINSWSLM